MLKTRDVVPFLSWKGILKTTHGWFRIFGEKNNTVWMVIKKPLRMMGSTWNKVTTFPENWVRFFGFLKHQQKYSETSKGSLHMISLYLQGIDLDLFFSDGFTSHSWELSLPQYLIFNVIRQSHEPTLDLISTLNKELYTTRSGQHVNSPIS